MKKLTDLFEVMANSNHLYGGSSLKIPGDGAHKGQEGWQSNNAWDIKASIGTPVYAVVGGTLKTYSDYGPTPIKKDGKTLFGGSFTVKSDEGLPDVYYTHLKDVKVRQGSRVECGQLLGYVMDFPGSDYDHLHIGVETGHVRQFLNDDGTLKCGDGKLTPFTPESVLSTNTSSTDTSSTDTSSTTKSLSREFDTVAQNIQNGILGSLTSAAFMKESVSLKEQRLIKNINKIKKLL